MNDAAWFLNELFPTVPAESRLLIFALPSRASAFFPCAGEAAAYALELAEAVNVYVGCGLRRPGTPKRGGDADITGLPGLWVDLDVAHGVHTKENLPPNLDAALQLVGDMPVPPTIVLDSGHGLQAWWLWEELYEIESPADLVRVREALYGWQALLRRKAAAYGWTVDSTHDPARIMRIAGTVNRKEAERPVPVTVISRDGPRTAGPDSFSEWATSPPDGATAAAAGASASVAGGLVIDPQAQPPYEKTDALSENSAKFRQSVSRTRKDLADQSPSSYDASLASLCVLAGWGDQEIVNLLIATHRRHKDDWGKHEWGDYFGRTLRLARTRHGQQTAAAELAALGTDAEPSRAAMLHTLRALLGGDLAVAGFLQHGEEPAMYSLQLEGGAEIGIGRVEALLSPERFRARVIEATHGRANLPLFKRAEWLAVVTALGKLVEYLDDPEGTRSGQLREWLEEYVTTSSVAEDEEGQRTATPAGDPFISNGDLFIQVESLRRFIFLRRMERVEVSDLRDMLRAAGFTRKTVAARSERDSVTTKSYWRRNLAWIYGTPYMEGKTNSEI